MALDLVSIGFAVLLVGLVVCLRDTSKSGFIDVALISLMSISALLNEVVNYWTELQTSVASASRIRAFQDNTPPEDMPDEKIVPPVQWPHTGKMEIHDVSVSYESQLVLKSITATIKGGERIDVCGPSGSGKSSLILALMRALDVRSGYIVVDGIDLTHISRHTISERFTAIPQEPFSLCGSVRENMDPFGHKNDRDIQNALSIVGLWDTIETRGGLDAELVETSFSQGEKQLLSLSRALLKSTQILLLDEVTSSADTETEKTVQKVIAEGFSNCTIIAVTHRLETIMDFDWISVLSDGRIVEFDTLQSLLSRPSMFSRLVKNSVQFDLR